MAGGTLDIPALITALVAKQVSEGLSLRAVGRQIKVSASTLIRLQQGKRPSVATLNSVAAWVGYEARETSREPTGEAWLSAVSPHLQGKAMTAEAALALGQLIASAYRLARALDAAPKSTGPVTGK